MRIAAVLCLLVPVLVRAETRNALDLLVHETQTVQMLGVTAAWAVDAAVVDASAQQGSVVLFGRAPGATKVIVVSVTGQHTYDVTVAARPGTTTAPGPMPAARATAEVRYSSATREIQNRVTVTREGRQQQRSEVDVRTIHQTDTPQGERARTSVATASVRLFRRNRELTLLDRDVDHSPLTLAATPLRGIHYLDDHWRLHAGITAYATYRSFLIPVERRFVAGGGYAFRAGPRSTVTPTFFMYRGAGTVASLIYDYRDADRLFVRGEVGYSDGVGGAAELAYDSSDDRVRANLRYRPDGFAVAGNAAPHGFFGDASWTHDSGRGSSVTVSGSATDTAGARVLSAGADVDHRLTQHVILTGGATWAAFDDARTIAIPLGARLDFPRGGLGAVYRYSRSETNEGGPGLRVFARAARGRFSASAYADHQRNAPTLGVIFAERPDLALALTELGIVASSPADVARALREHAILAELGFIDGVTLDLAPSRTQLGIEMAWLGTTRARQQFRARVLRNVTEGVARQTTTTIASLSYARALTDTTDVFASWTYWRTEVAGGGAPPSGLVAVQPFLELGVRQRLDGAFLGGTGMISGVVFADENLDGRSDGAGIAAQVELDGARTARTRDDGTFVFTGVPRGSHRVVARVPQRADAYFTTPSRVDAETGDRLGFGVAFTPARLLVRMIDDAGDAVAGVRIQLARGSQRLTGTSESDGALAVAASPGEWELSIVGDSVPPGYAFAGIEPRMVMLDRARPLHVEQVLPALRTISGHAAPHAKIEVRPLDRRVRADAEGRFTVRSLPPRVVTLVCGSVMRRVDVPRGPATIDVNCRP
jgi:hypothetical protein